jgi:hypothetical protein
MCTNRALRGTNNLQNTVHTETEQAHGD